MDKHQLLQHYIQSHPGEIGKVVDFDPIIDRLFLFDFSTANTELNTGIIADTGRFSKWVSQKLQTSQCRYGIGGYMEHRTIYARSEHFDTEDEPRRLHLGVDIWANAGIPVYCPLAGQIHSFRDNDHHGDYGPTIILQHDLGGLPLYSLYGHLSRKDMEGLQAGDIIPMGKQLGAFGTTDENGHWPPHLHFQLMFDMEGWWGDYPGVGKFSEKKRWLVNIPDPALILQFKLTKKF